MIYSTLPEHGEILKRLLKLKENNIGYFDDSNFVEIQSLDKATSVAILNDWLIRDERSLSREQWRCLEGMLEEVTKSGALFPLYISLLFDVVVKWTSLDVPDQAFLKCLNIDKYLFFDLFVICIVIKLRS